MGAQTGRQRPEERWKKKGGGGGGGGREYTNRNAIRILLANTLSLCLALLERVFVLEFAAHVYRLDAGWAEKREQGENKIFGGVGYFWVWEDEVILAAYSCGDGWRERKQRRSCGVGGMNS